MGVMGTIGGAVGGATAVLREETPSPRLDAELLLASVLKQPREYLLAHGNNALTLREKRAFTSLVRRRAEGVPLAYLTRRKEFYGRVFAMTPAVMVPRPESEAIIDETIRLLGETRETREERRETRNRMRLSPSASLISHPVVADIGTGSGVLAISIAADVPRARGVAADISEAALAVARGNARRHRVSSRITFIKSDLLTEIPRELTPALLVANLPYVPHGDLQRAPTRPETGGLAFEPPRALDGGPDGLFVIRRFFAQLRRRAEFQKTLRALILEHHPDQRRRILELAQGVLPGFAPRAVTPFVTSWERKNS